MTNKNIYQYSIWYRDSKDSANDVLIREVTSVAAVSEEHTHAIAIRSIGAEWDSKIENIKVEIRSFLGPPTEASSPWSDGQLMSHGRAGKYDQVIPPIKDKTPVGSKKPTLRNVIPGGTYYSGPDKFYFSDTDDDVVVTYTPHGIKPDQTPEVFDIVKMSNGAGLTIIPTNETITQYGLPSLLSHATNIFNFCNANNIR